MVHHPQNGAPAQQPPWLLLWVGRQLLLVPEAVLLLTLLCLHVGLGAPLATALLGVLVVGWFGCRSALLVAARHALNRADYERAHRLSGLALTLYPYSADAHALRGALHMAQGHTAEAEVALRRAIAYYPGQARLHAALSGVLLEDNRLVEARWEAAHALALDTRCASAYLHLAHADRLIGAAPSDIEAHLRAGLYAQPAPEDEAALRCTLAALLLAQGRQPEAQFALVGAEALLIRCPAPQRAGLHYFLGELRQGIGDRETAYSHFNASETLDPQGRYAAAAWRAARS